MLTKYYEVYKKIIDTLVKRCYIKDMNYYHIWGKRSIILLIFIIFKGELLENILSY